MAEKLRKLAIYFRPTEAYWTATDEAEELAVSPGPTGRYPLNLIPRLQEGHYDRFDDEGIPIRLAENGGGSYYNYTTVCSYALANWETYLLGGETNNAKILVTTAEFLIRSAEAMPDGSLLLRDTRDDSLSSMFQGEAVSVLSRAWHYTKEDRFTDAIKGCILPFRRPLEDNGVLATVSANGATWYEERGELPVRHILNGMIYALWGLRDASLAIGDPTAETLFRRGVDSVEQCLPLFDTGYWSRYWVPEDDLDYIASMMYHNLHIVQLSALARQTGRDIFQQHADRYDRYAGKMTRRMRAGLTLALNKRSLQRDIRHSQ